MNHQQLGKMIPKLHPFLKSYWLWIDNGNILFLEDVITDRFPILQCMALHPCMYGQL